MKKEKEERWLGDYDVQETFDKKRAQFRLEEAQKFVNRIKTCLKKSANL